MRTRDGDQIIINIVGHDPDGVINATTVQYMRRGTQIRGVPYDWPKFRFILSRAIRQWSRRQWSREADKEQ